MRRGAIISFLSALIMGWLLFSTVEAQSDTANMAGQVITASGSLQASNSNSVNRELKRGAYFYSGDLITTGTNASAQIRFTDGTLVALTPNSKLKVDEYHYQKDASSDKSVVTLVQGGFRAITGAISKENPSAYRAQTPVAVIGVRGTNYGAVIVRGQLFSGVWKGGIFVQNKAGTIDLGKDNQFSFTKVISSDVAPIGLSKPPTELSCLKFGNNT